MSSSYTYDPHALDPWLAGLTAGAVGAIAGTLLAFTLRSPDEIIANSLTVTVGALLIGLASGWLWRRVRATDNGLATFRWAMVGGFFAALIAIAIVDQTALGNLIGYGVPVAALIFVTVGLLTPYFATVHWPMWAVAIPVIVAFGLAVGLFGRGNVASGELSLSDLTTTTLAPPSVSNPGVETTAAPTTTLPTGPLSEFVITQGSATWTVPETLRGLSARAVGRSDELVGTIIVGKGFEFTIDLTTFQSDQPRRDSFVRDLFASDPIARFTASEFQLPDAPDGEVVTMQVAGTLTVNGVDREVVWDVEARKDGTVVLVTGELDIALTDFDIPPPNLGFVEVEDEAHLEVLFEARGA